MSPLLTSRILTLSFLSSLGLYAMVVFLVAPDMEPSGLTTLGPALAVAAFLTAAAIPAIRKVVMGHHALTPVDSLALYGDQSMAADRAQVAWRAALTRYQVGTITGLALAEAVAVYGLVLALVNATPTAAVPFLVSGAVLIVIQFPREGCAKQLLSPDARAALRRG